MKKLYQKDWLHFVGNQQESESIFYCFEWRSKLKCVICTRRYCKIQCPGSVLECPIVQWLTFTEIEAKSPTFLFLNLSNVATVSPLKKKKSNKTKKNLKQTKKIPRKKPKRVKKNHSTHHNSCSWFGVFSVSWLVGEFWAAQGILHLQVLPANLKVPIPLFL